MHLFVYGSLRQPARLDEVLGRRYGGARLPARLDGFKRQRAAGYAYPFLVPAADGQVDGLLLLDLSDDDLAAVDVYEEVAEGRYRRVTVTVTVQAGGQGVGGRTESAQTYLAGPSLLGAVAAGKLPGGLIQT